MKKFNSLESIVREVARSVRPPERLDVSQAAEKYIYVNNPGSYVGPYKIETTPYLEEPQNLLISKEKTGMIFVGPAQSGKTDMVLNWLTHTTLCDPRDMMIVLQSQSTSKDFAKRRVGKLFRNTKPVARMITPGRNNQNTFDTRFINGMMLTLSWPSARELSGKPVPYMWISDYDRIEDDVDGEGDAYGLAKKRTTSFGVYGMTVAESSPGKPLQKTKWSPSTPHEAPPATGILALYNRGDRRRWYWPCPHCETWFEPDFPLLRWPNVPDFMEAAQNVHLECPKCSGKIYHDGEPDKDIPGKYELNKKGVWVPDGMWIDKDGSLNGEPPRSDTASFWLKGVAAAFSNWRGLVYDYLVAEDVFEKTGSQETLKSHVNTGLGLPYFPKGAVSDRLPEELKARAKDYGEKVVPEGVRFLVAAIDVQKHRFEVQIHGFGVGGDIWVIDRFNVRKSERLDEDGERLWVNPGAYEDDWHILATEVLEKSYELSDGSGRRMPLKAVVCDSGGLESSTKNSYSFWRWLRDEYPGEWHRRFMLLKGAYMKNAPRVQISYPDADRKDRKAGARGEVPILIINTNEVKDQVSHMLDRKEPGGGRICFPKWLPDSWYNELVAETRTAKGWENAKKYRNESWDLLVYSYCAALSRMVQIERIDWKNPPSWAEEWDHNDMIMASKEDKKFDYKKESDYTIEELGNMLA